MEKHHESAYRCSRVGYADCQPDLRSVVSRRAAGADQRVPGEPQLRGQRLLIADHFVQGPGEGPLVRALVMAWFSKSTAGHCAGRTDKRARSCRRIRCSRTYGSPGSLRLWWWPRLHSPAGQQTNLRRSIPSAASAS